MASVVPALVLLLAVQSYGGSAPWGLERPTVIHGEVRRGEAFEQEISPGLWFRLAPNEQGWRIEVGDRADDFTRCVNPPFHGLTALDLEGSADREADQDGRRWFDFVLTAKDQTKACADLDEMLYHFERSQKTEQDLSTSPPEERRVTGRGWLRIAKLTGDFEAMTFDAELTLLGALRLWQMPSRYIIPTNYQGWVGVSGNAAEAPAAPLASGHYQLRVPPAGLFRTSTDLRMDGRDAEYVFANGTRLPASGPRKRVWGSWHVGEGRCGGYLMFFVGTKTQYERARAAGPPRNIRCD
jgi:hypothetical protein